MSAASSPSGQVPVLTHGSSLRRRIAGTFLGALLLVPLAIHCWLLLLAPEDIGAQRWLHHLLFNAPFVAAALACYRRSRRRGADRLAWRVQSIAVVCFLLGNLYGATLGDFSTYPSPADALWLSFYLLSYVAVVLYARAHRPGHHPAGPASTRSRAAVFLSASRLDGAIGGIGAAALVSGLAMGPVLRVTEGSWTAVATNLAYPTADLLLILLLVTVGTSLAVPDRVWVLLASGFALFLVGDTIFLLRMSAGTWEAGSVPDLLWPAGVALIGLAACSRPSRYPAPTRTHRHRQLIPAVFSVGALILLVHGQGQNLPTVAVVLAVGTLLLAGARMLVTLREVESLARSRHEARRDYLTGLPNRRALAETLTSSIAVDTTTSLIVLDLDRFNEINDSLGHAAGDQLLIDVGIRLELAGPPGAELARLGGDEFAVVLPEVGLTEALEIAKAYTECFRAPFGLSDLLVPVNASIGVASAPVHSRTHSDLIAAADIAMYQAKRDRSGVAVFRVETNNPSRGRLELLADLRTALEHDEFVLHYQPQLEIRTGAVIGVEALVRWNHPERGLVPPDEFIPMLTTSSLIHEFTSGVIRTAVAARATLGQAGFEVSMSVNISALDLGNRELPSVVEQALSTHRVPADSLVLEVTEDSVMADRTASRHRLGELHDLGSRLSMDDYGTGQASLGYLRDLPLDELKLDRSFLRGTPLDHHNAAIVRSTIELAHALALPIVAEGVEDHTVLNWLGSLDCDIAQGFHISRPQPLADLLPWLEGRPVAVL